MPDWRGMFDARPLALFRMQLALWLAAAVLFGVLNLQFSSTLSAIVAPMPTETKSTGATSTPASAPSAAL